MQYKIIVDKQPRTNLSDEKKEYIIDIEELRVKGNVYDSLNIEMDKTYVTRRLSLSQYGVLSVLDTPIIEEIPDADIELFEGDNYIYLSDMEGNHFYAEYVLKNDFTNIFTSKAELNSAINQTARNVEISVNQKLENYSTTEEMNAAIDVKADEINLELSKKVDDEELTGANITLRINEDTSEAMINADKISLEGKEINLTGDDVNISSTNFNVDKNGNMTCNNASMNNVQVNGGHIQLQDTSGVGDEFEINSDNYQLRAGSSMFSLNDLNNDESFIYMTTSETSEPTIYVSKSGNTRTIIAGSEIKSPKLTQTSLEVIKKNINKFTKNATDIINKSDIYEYNLKSDKDTDKKLIGFIIGENYKTPSEVISKEGQAVELYSSIGILWKAVQEMSEEIKQLKEVQHD